MNNELFLRRTIRRIITEEFLRVGDVKTALAAAKKQKKIEKAQAFAKEAGKKGVVTALKMIPGVSQFVDIIDASVEIGDLYKAAKGLDPEEKKKNALWDYLSIDPEASAIVDDNVESKFISDLEAKVSSLNDEEQLPNADELLKNWLTNKYSGTHITK